LFRDPLCLGDTSGFGLADLFQPVSLFLCRPFLGHAAGFFLRSAGSGFSLLAIPHLFLSAAGSGFFLRTTGGFLLLSAASIGGFRFTHLAGDFRLTRLLAHILIRLRGRGRSEAGEVREFFCRGSWALSHGPCRRGRNGDGLGRRSSRR
jgi:hypothetical protein